MNTPDPQPSKEVGVATPRTDAEAEPIAHGFHHMVAFARGLEREIVALKGELGEARKTMDLMREHHLKTCESLRFWQSFAREMGEVLKCASVSDDILSKAQSVAASEERLAVCLTNCLVSIGGTNLPDNPEIESLPIDWIGTASYDARGEKRFNETVIKPALAALTSRPTKEGTKQ